MTFEVTEPAKGSYQLGEGVGRVRQGLKGPARCHQSSLTPILLLKLQACNTKPSSGYQTTVKKNVTKTKQFIFEIQ